MNTIFVLTKLELEDEGCRATISSTETLGFYTSDEEGQDYLNRLFSTYSKQDPDMANMDNKNRLVVDLYGGTFIYELKAVDNLGSEYFVSSKKRDNVSKFEIPNEDIDLKVA